MSETCAKAPCKSCPYRQDVPPGVWHAEEYAKLPPYDLPIAGQALAIAMSGGGNLGVFMCHQQDGRICAGWVGCHGPSNLLALRLASAYDLDIDPSVFAYESPVPLFASGAEAAAHGMSAIEKQPPEARRMVERLLVKRKRQARKKRKKT